MPVNYTNGQCAAVKKNGEQCLNNANHDSIFCGSHQNHTGRVFTPSDLEVRSNLANSLSQQSEETQAEVRAQIDAIANKESTMTMEEYDDQFWSEIREDYDVIIGLTGSRSLQLESKERQLEVLAEVREYIRGKNALIVSGTAEGFDACGIKAAQLEDKDYVAAIPSPSYGNYYWGPPQGKKGGSLLKKDRRETYNGYLEHERCIQKIYVCETHLNGKANFIRNQYMVDHADEFLVYNPESPGTKDCLNRIKAKGLKYTVIGEDKENPADKYDACPSCGGDGKYKRGKVVNGKFEGMIGTCYPCAGKGYQDDKDIARNKAYWANNMPRA